MIKKHRNFVKEMFNNDLRFVEALDKAMEKVVNNIGLNKQRYGMHSMTIIRLYTPSVDYYA